MTFAETTSTENHTWQRAQGSLWALLSYKSHEHWGCVGTLSTFAKQDGPERDETEEGDGSDHGLGWGEKMNIHDKSVRVRHACHSQGLCWHFWGKT